MKNILNNEHIDMVAAHSLQEADDILAHNAHDIGTMVVDNALPLNSSKNAKTLSNAGIWYLHHIRGKYPFIPRIFYSQEVHHWLVDRLKNSCKVTHVAEKHGNHNDVIGMIAQNLHYNKEYLEEHVGVSKGGLVVMTGPSKSAKTSLALELWHQHPHLEFYPTYTTRPLRMEEQPGGYKAQTKRFIDESTMQRLKRRSDVYAYIYKGFEYLVDYAELNELIEKGNRTVLYTTPVADAAKDILEAFDGYGVQTMANARLLELKSHRSEHDHKRDPAEEIASYVDFPATVVLDTSILTDSETSDEGSVRPRLVPPSKADLEEFVLRASIFKKFRRSMKRVWDPYMAQASSLERSVLENRYIDTFLDPNYRDYSRIVF